MKTLFCAVALLFVASTAFAKDGIAVKNLKTFSDKDSKCVVLEFMADSLDICLENFTVETDLGIGQLDTIGCSMARVGGYMSFYVPNRDPKGIMILKATGTDSAGKKIDAKGLLKPVKPGSAKLLPISVK